MARKFQGLALLTSILVVLSAYLYHVPNSEGVEQMGRIRLLSASMKVISFIVRSISSIFIIMKVINRLLYIGLCI